MNGHAEQPLEYDVIIIGSGISGINTAQRIQTNCPPGTTYTILERRSDMGGTWNFFKYPGLRSDSDLHTFGFPWRGWKEERPIATSDSIMKYMRESAESEGIDKKIRYNHKVISADWSSETLKWTFRVEVNGREQIFLGRFMILGTGYYDYDKPMQTEIPGLERFQGKIIHTQFWPEDYDHSGKNIAIIGSGATAVTLLPALAKTAAHVTIVQRSPSYIMSLPSRDPLGKFLHSFLPQSWMSSFNRIRFLFVSYAFFYFCQYFPNVGRRLLFSGTRKQLPPHIPFEPHFVPSYNPWEQRLCLCPDGDFFKALRKGNCDMVTGTIKTVTEKGIMMDSGDALKFDTIVTATGLKLHLAGGINFTVDGKPFRIPEKFMWKGVMMQDLPNVVFIVGYTNASWTLGAEATAQMFCSIFKYMKRNGYSAAVPRLENPESMPSAPMLNLNSTYIKNSLHIMPKTGATGQWRPRSNYFVDLREAKNGDITTDMQYIREGEIKKVEQNGSVKA